MSSGPSPDPDFLDRAPISSPPDAEALFDGLSEDLEEFRRLRADVRAAVAAPCPERFRALQQAERAVYARLRALGWCPATETAHARIADTGGSRPRGSAVAAPRSDADWDPARAALALVVHLAAVDHDSGEMVERMEDMGDGGPREVLSAAQRCQALIGDALVIGALDLAVRIGVPDNQLPL